MEAPRAHDASHLAREFFATALSAADATASAHGGWHQTESMLGDVLLKLQTFGETAADMSRAFIPYRPNSAGGGGDEDSSRSIQVRLLTTAGYGTPLPHTTWDWSERDYRSDRYSFSFDVNRRLLTAVDVEAREAVVWFAGDRIGAWERAAPVRPIIDRLLAQFGLTMLHAGSLGRGDRAILFAGRGGSGKSTLVRAGVRNKMKTVGDDFLLLVQGTPAVVAPLYRTVRLQSSSPSYDATLDRIEDDGFANDKALVLLEEDGTFLRRQQPVAIASMFVSGDVRSALEPVSTIEVLQALLPSSLILADRRREAMSTLTGLARSLPSYRLAVGSDLNQALELVDNLLERLGAA